MKTLVTAAIVLSLAACSTPPRNIDAQYISTHQYDGLSCEELTLEYYRVETRVQQLHHALDQESKKDAALVGVGLVVFWPALLFLAGSSTDPSEYGRLKGEAQALQTVLANNTCEYDPSELIADAKTKACDDAKQRIRDLHPSAQTRRSQLKKEAVKVCRDA